MPHIVIKRSVAMSVIAATAMVAIIAMAPGMQQTAVAQSVEEARQQPTLITPRVGAGGIGQTQQGALPQPELTPEQKRLLLQLRIMQIEGGRAYVRQACQDPTWVNDYKTQLEEIEITKRPEALEAFKIGWNESKERLGPTIVSCEQMMRDIM